MNNIDELTDKYITEARGTTITFELEEHAGRDKSGNWTVIEKSNNFNAIKALLKEKRELNPKWEYRIVKYTTKSTIMTI